MLKIAYLADYKENTETIINWLWAEFGNEANRDFFESIIKHSLKKNSLPLTFIALSDNELVGTISLWRADLVSRQDLYPWLSALYVKENYRNKGIGQKLQDFVLTYCKNTGFSELFLYTDIDDYYEKTGWKHFEDGVEYSGNYIKIYKKEL
ncbi:GNAT family N-acetyltransferase [Clostridium botulinum]|nr:GNAT family N-acetyltransferase [Clostridium botulinum]NFR15653.1 GNAT family N-acetyltransferase [Clostridium botulinum]NFR44647.1 GNAT family N-acetyltransferase [Clostridium botulinum]NFS51730.1 GNAT family N-acetyltransferase [Clostridium botulinum]